MKQMNIINYSIFNFTLKFHWEEEKLLIVTINYRLNSLGFSFIPGSLQKKILDIKFFYFFFFIRIIIPIVTIVKTLITRGRS